MSITAFDDDDQVKIDTRNHPSKETATETAYLIHSLSVANRTKYMAGNRIRKVRNTRKLSSIESEKIN